MQSSLKLPRVTTLRPPKHRRAEQNQLSVKLMITRVGRAGQKSKQEQSMLAMLEASVSWAEMLCLG